MGALVRLAIPTALLVLGGVAYSYLSIEPAKEKTPPAEKKAIRTKIAKLRLEDYQIIIKTNGIVQSHNEVGLSAEVSGTITSISPKFIAGGVFAKDEVLMRIDPTNYSVSVDQAEALVKQRRIEFDGASKLRSQGYRAEAEYASAADESGGE